MNAIIETERLFLREFIIEDIPAAFELNANPVVQKYTGDTLIETIEQAADIINNVVLKDYKNYGYGRWAVIYKPDNKLIGFAGLKYLPEIGETDLGFRFLPQYWGKGIATEASREIIKYAFKNLAIDKIIGIAMPENIASCRVLEKVGLKQYKVAEYDGDGHNNNWYKINKLS